MKLSWPRYAAWGAMALLAPRAEALPGASIGEDCEKFAAREVAAGAKRIAQPDVAVLFLTSQFDGRRMQANYNCEKGIVGRKFAFVDAISEVDAVDLYYRLRREVESELGPPAIDYTQPELRSRFAEALGEDSESFMRDIQYNASWVSNGIERVLGVSEHNGRWRVSVSEQRK